MNDSTEKEKFWYALRTASRTEKRIKERLDGAEIENFLPLRIRVSKWSDRIKKIKEPLISCYIFVRIEKDKISDALHIQGAIGVVKEDNMPVIIPEGQMQNFIRSVELAPEKISFSSEYMKSGEQIIVKKGPFMGLKGEIVEYQNAKHIIIRLKSIGCAFISIGEDSIEKQI